MFELLISSAQDLTFIIGDKEGCSKILMFLLLFWTYPEFLRLENLFMVCYNCDSTVFMFYSRIFVFDFDGQAFKFIYDLLVCFGNISMPFRFHVPIFDKLNQFSNLFVSIQIEFGVDVCLEIFVVVLNYDYIVDSDGSNMSS